MTENTTNMYPTTEHGNWGQPPATPPKKPRWYFKPAVLLPIAALMIGLGIGGATGKTETVEVTKEVTKEVPVEKIVTKTVEVPVTPDSCLEALTINEQAFTYLSESMGHIVDGDFSAANASTERVKALVPKSNAAKAECRAS